MIEEFKWIKGFEGLYKVSNFGRIYSVQRYDKLNRLRGGIFVSTRKTPFGYIIVSLNKDGKQYTFFLHRLVAKAFIANPLNKPEVDHINGDKTDNRVVNLRWCTKSENIRNPVTYAKMSDNAKKNPVRGSKNPFSRKVVQFTLNGDFINEYESTGDAAISTGISTFSIQKCALGKRKSGGGYVWKYTTEPIMRSKGRRAIGDGGTKIVQIDCKGNIIASFVSIQDAARKTGFYAENIGRAVRGIYKTYRGFRWNRSES
jgi:hypothetical protein